jgi:hypothetical protein
LIYATAIHNVNTLTESNKKEILSADKKLKKKVQDDQGYKFLHDEKMMSMQLHHEKFVYERKKGQEGKEGSG